MTDQTTLTLGSFAELIIKNVKDCYSNASPSQEKIKTPITLPSSVWVIVHITNANLSVKLGQLLQLNLKNQEQGKKDRLYIYSLLTMKG